MSVRDYNWCASCHRTTTWNRTRDGRSICLDCLRSDSSPAVAHSPDTVDRMTPCDDTDKVATGWCASCHRAILWTRSPHTGNWCCELCNRRFPTTGLILEPEPPLPPPKPVLPPNRVVSCWDRPLVVWTPRRTTVGLFVLGQLALILARLVL